MFKGWTRLEGFGLAALLLVCINGFIFAVPGWTPFLDWIGGDKASGWAQAVGSVAAICAAVWTVTKEDRRRDGDALVMADIAAVTVIGKLIPMQACFASFRRQMSHDGENSFNAAARLKQLDQLALPSINEVRELMPVGGGCASKLAEILGKVEIIRAVTQRAADDPAVRSAALGTIVVPLAALPEDLSALRKALVEFLTIRGVIVSDPWTTNTSTAVA